MALEMSDKSGSGLITHDETRRFVSLNTASAAPRPQAGFCNGQDVATVAGY